MEFRGRYSNKNGFNNDDINDILRSSKLQNIKYLDDILSIKGISSFDASYIMSKLELSQEKIELIKLSLKKYDSMKNLKEKETYSDFLFGIVRNIEELEKKDNQLQDEITQYRRKIQDISSFADYLILKSCSFLKEKPAQNFVFSPLYINNSLR